MKHVLNGAEIAYDVAGEGPAVLLIHAGIADRRMWDHQVAAFSDRYRVIRMDLRGFGESTQLTEDYSHHEDARALLDHLGIGRAVLAGDSMGGEAAVDLALAYPDRVAALVLIATRAAGGEVSAELRQVWDDADAAYERGDVEAAVEIETVCWIDGAGRAPAEVDPDYRRMAREMIRLTWERAEEPAGEQVLLSPPRADRLHEITVPTLLVYGDRDLPDIVRSMETLAAAIPNARLRVIENAVHLPPLERPEEFNRILEEFLESLHLPS